MSEPKTSNMYLVYEDDKGEQFYQHWSEVVQNGTLTDDQGEDMEIIGWDE